MAPKLNEFSFSGHAVPRARGPALLLFKRARLIPLQATGPVAAPSPRMRAMTPSSHSSSETRSGHSAHTTSHRTVHPASSFEAASATPFSVCTSISNSAVQRSYLPSSPPLSFFYQRRKSIWISCHFSYKVSRHPSTLLLAACLLALVYFSPGLSQPWCKYDRSLTPEETVSQNCGFICPDPWGKENPHECGPPHSCCCAPKCDIEEAKKHAFVGVNWSDKYSRMRLSREKQLSVLKKNGFYHIKIFAPDSLSAIWNVYGPEGNAYVGLPNAMLTRLVTDETFAHRLVEKQLKPYSSIIRTVIVGNEPLLCIRTAQWASKQECGSLNVPAKLMPALKIVKKALVSSGLPHIPVSTALNGGILEMSTNPWTPCVADYRDAVKPILRQLWTYLSEQTPPAPFIVNIYSWFAALHGHIKPDIAVGHPAEHLPSDGQYNYYFNFDMQVEMQRVAMCKNNITHLDLWIGETGWPTGNSPRATLTNAYLYAKHAVMRSRGMTLNDPTLDNIRTVGMPYPIFLFEAFDEAAKFEIEHGNKFENTFGLFYENGQPKWSNPDGLIDLPLERRPEKTKQKSSK